MKKNAFSEKLLSWFELHGRKDLPWQHPRNAYRVWISEIMLQQTQVKTVIPYFTKFMSRFPNVEALACASDDEVLSYWSGLGYYSRARNLHKAAQIIYREHANVFPDTLEKLIKLPGIGATTAAAITSQAFNKPDAILDSNVKRVLSRCFLVPGAPDSSNTKQQLWRHANECMPDERCVDYTQAIMDLGATCCKSKNPTCTLCPLQTLCLAYQHQQVNMYPHKTLKKKPPLKAQQFLLMHHNHLIYLEKRPPTGLWGGLWCLPSIDMEICATTHVQNRYQLQINASQKLMQLKHAFSHYQLDIEALSLQCSPVNQYIAEEHGKWFKQEELNGLGLAKPVHTIIQFFYRSFEQGNAS